MARLIDADELLKKAEYIPTGLKSRGMQVCCHGVTAATIENAPTIDPESLRPTAHWIKDGEVENPYRGSGTKYHCSACGRRAGYKQRWIYKYCPHCGAKMEDTDES